MQPPDRLKRLAGALVGAATLGVIALSANGASPAGTASPTLPTVTRIVDTSSSHAFLAAVVAGHIVQQGTDGKLHHYDVAGYVVVVTSLLACYLMWRVERGVRGATAAVPAAGHP